MAHKTVEIDVDIDLDDFDDDELIKELEDRGIVVGDGSGFPSTITEETLSETITEETLSDWRDHLLRGKAAHVLADIEARLFPKGVSVMEAEYAKACDNRCPDTGRPMIV